MPTTPLTSSTQPNPAKENTMTSTELLRSVLDQWKSAVDAHDPKRVASYFTDDAIFQRLHPYSVGPEGVGEDNDSQPIGMPAACDVLATGRLAADLVLGCLSVACAFVDRRVLTVYLSVILPRIGADWLISPSQATRLD